MTRVEREQAAVQHKRCPVCRAQPGFRCTKASARIEYREHPHPERVALVTEVPGDPS